MDAWEADSKPPQIVIPIATQVWGVSPLAAYARRLRERDPQHWQAPPWPVNAAPPQDLLDHSLEVLLNAAGVPAELYQGDGSSRASSAVMADFFNAQLGEPFAGFDPASGPDQGVVQFVNSWGQWARSPDGGIATEHRTPAVSGEVTELLSEETRAAIRAWGVAPEQRTPAVLDEVMELSAEEALAVMRSWGRDEIDETTRREINEQLRNERPRPRPATNARARSFNNRAVISWEHTGAHVEKFIIKRAVDGDDEYTVVAELPQTARQFVDYDYLPDWVFEYWIDVEPSPQRYGALSRVTLTPQPTMTAKERLSWQVGECCLLMFGYTEFPGVEHYQAQRATVQRIVESLVSRDRLQNLMQTTFTPTADGWFRQRLPVPDMP
jgi:hypothetical protein